ncbi:MAG: glycosyltransferase [Acidobacteriota bacterium]
MLFWAAMRSSVSIVIPAYNCAPYLDDALTSVLGQSHAPHEVIVVDDGSTDDTQDVLRPFARQISLVRQENRGLSHARNRGLADATGRWVLFLDADDRLEPTALEALLSVSEADADHVIYGDKYVISHEGAIESRVPGRDATGPIPSASRASFNGSPFEPGAAMLPRALINALGGFHQRYSPCEDRYTWIRAGSLVEFRYVPSVVLHYRQRPGSLSKNRIRQVTGSLRARIDSLAWLHEQHVRLFDVEPEPAALVAEDLGAVYWQREWDVVDAVLALADEYQLAHPDIARIRRIRRYPTWLVAVKDALDRRRG